jgi:hypothetical protein
MSCGPLELASLATSPGATGQCGRPRYEGEANAHPCRTSLESTDVL